MLLWVLPGVCKGNMSCYGKCDCMMYAESSCVMYAGLFMWCGRAFTSRCLHGSAPAPNDV